MDSYLIRAQCTAAVSNLKMIQVALMTYFVDMGSYPTELENSLKQYLPNFPKDFTANFSYKNITNSQGNLDYEIRYIGHIGEASIATENKKDYKAMLSGATVPEIPTIFAHIPADSMVLYVRNPANLLDILNQKSNTTQRLS
jgi:hypothetical protein